MSGHPGGRPQGVSVGEMTHGAHPDRLDFDSRPILVFWETTRACLLACQHCRAEAIEEPALAAASSPEAMPGRGGPDAAGRIVRRLAFPGLLFVGRAFAGGIEQQEELA